MAYSPYMVWHRNAERLAAEGADLIAGGFPCQDISFAGEGAGLAGARSGLVWSLLRTIRLVRPSRALLENVAALLHRGLDQVLGRMAEIGYDAEWHCIPASAVGAPHQRDRIWIIATDAGSEQHESGGAPLSGSLTEELSRANSDAAPLFGPEVVESEPDGNTARTPEVADAHGAGLSLAWPQSSGENGRDSGRMLAAGGWWSAEPDVGRVANGVPYRVDRLRALGNAVVPQIPELIGRAILKAEGRLT